MKKFKGNYDSSTSSGIGVSIRHCGSTDDRHLLSFEAVREDFLEGVSWKLKPSGQVGAD